VQTLLYGDRPKLIPQTWKDPALRRGLYALEEIHKLQLEENQVSEETWASDDSIACFARDLYHSFNLGSWSVVGDASAKPDSNIEGYTYKIGEHREEVSVFMPDLDLYTLRSEKKRGIKVNGRACDWFGGLGLVGAALGLDLAG
jgi:hypothetical protein